MVPAAAHHSVGKTLTLSIVNFGGTGNGVVDDSHAFNGFGTFARNNTECSIVLLIPDGTFTFNQFVAFTALEGIPILTLQGNGTASILSNIVANAGPSLPDCFPNIRDYANGGVSDLIDSTFVGNTFVTLKTPANAANYPVGASAIVMSEDIQISSSNFSYPPNCNLFDFVHIRTADPATGIIQFFPGLNNAHSENNIDGSQPNPCGKARIWLLDTPTTSPTLFQINHLYKDIKIVSGPTPAWEYVGMGGEYIRWEDSTITGFSPSTAKRVELINVIQDGVAGNANEPDKLVDTFLLDGVTTEQSVVFQSSSINNVTIKNSTIGVFLGAGTAKNVLVENCILPIFGEGIAGSKFGHNLSTTLRDCVISQWAPFFFGVGWWVTGGANPLLIDGVSITYAADVITVPKTTPDLADWNVVPNVTHLNLATTASSYFTGDIGTALVTSLTEDATNIYYHVAGWPAALPAFATGVIYVSRSGPLYCYNLIGCTEAISASAATAAGKFPWQLLVRQFAEADGFSGTAGNMVGDFLSIEVTVANPTITPGNLWQLATNLVDATTMVGSQQLLINIDITIAGTRTFTQSALTGKVGNDDVLLAGVSQATMPVGKWAQTVPSWAYANGLPPTPRALTVDVTAEFDPGSDFRKAAP